MLLADGYSVTDLTTTLGTVAATALPYLGAGIAAGAVLLGVVWGVRKAVDHLRFLAWDGESDKWGNKD